MILGIIKNGEKELLVGGKAAHVKYDNGNSGLSSTDVQGAIDELSADIANKIGYVDVDVSGVAITNADGAWYYSASIPITIPNGAEVIGCFPYGPSTSGVIPTANGSLSISLMCYKSYTMPTNRKIRVVYFK